MATEIPNVTKTTPTAASTLSTVEAASKAYSEAFDEATSAMFEVLETVTGNPTFYDKVRKVTVAHEKLISARDVFRSTYHAKGRDKLADEVSESRIMWARVFDSYRNRTAAEYPLIGLPSPWKRSSVQEVPRESDASKTATIKEESLDGEDETV